MTSSLQEELEQTRKSLLETCKTLAAFDVDEVGKKMRVFRINGERWLAHAEECRQLAAEVLGYIPHIKSILLLEEIHGPISAMNNALTSFATADPASISGSGGTGNWSTHDQRLMSLFGTPNVEGNSGEKESQNVARRLRAIIAYLRTVGIDGHSPYEQSERISVIHDAATRQSHEIAAILEKVRAAPSQVTARTFASVFEGRAKTHEDASRQFLFAAGGLAGLLFLLLGWVLLKEVMKIPADAYHVTEIATRAVMVSVLVAATLFCARQYRAHKHLAVTNLHRADVLVTYDMILASTDDKDARTALLREAATCIFQPGSTGLLNQKDDVGHQQVFELLRDAVLKK